MTTYAEIHLARRPAGAPSSEDFQVVAAELPDCAPGQVLVRNRWMSVDPYMRLPLGDAPGIHAPMAVGAPMQGAAVGVIERSRNPAWQEGAPVVHDLNGWREAYVSDGTDLRPAAPGAPLNWNLGVLGLTGITAYTGVEFVLDPQPGETVFVSAAAGAVGSLACQLAKRRGCTVIGSAGSEEKLGWVRELGVDYAFNYKTTDVRTALAEACPRGLDAYLDNVGGSTLEAVIDCARIKGRIALCGAIAQYNDGNYRVGPSNFFGLIEKSLDVKGFNVTTHADRSEEMLRRLSEMLSAEELVARETVVEGLENAPLAFVSMLRGDNFGKMLVKL